MHCHQEEVYLPWTNQQYKIDRHGLVKEGEQPISLKIINGVRMVELDWYDGRRMYQYDQIPIVCYFKIKIPIKFLDRIELIFKDSNSDNLTIDNLAYRFKGGPVESIDFPGYFYVPYYTDYVVDRSGSTIGLKLFKKHGAINYKKWSISTPVKKKNIKGGYCCGRGKRDFDDVDGVSRHRFIALTFIEYSSDPLSLTVNHKNGIPGDDRIENLEWVTYSENTKHAYANGLYLNKVVSIISSVNGNEQQHPTVQHCVDVTGFTRGFIEARMKKPFVDYGDGLKFKLDDGREWPKVTAVGTPLVIRAVMAKDVFTGDITIFENMEKASAFTTVDSATVSYHCTNKPMTPTKGFNFRYAEVGNIWSECSEYHLRMYRRFPVGLVPNGLFLLDGSSRIVAFFECFKDFQDVSGVSENQIYSMLRKNKTWEGLHLRKFDVRGTL